jgi:hypothetical protein
VVVGKEGGSGNENGPNSEVWSSGVAVPIEIGGQSLVEEGSL